MWLCWEWENERKQGPLVRASLSEKPSSLWSEQAILAEPQERWIYLYRGLVRVLGCLLWPLAAPGNPPVRAHFLVMTQLFLSDRPVPRGVRGVCAIVLTSSCWRTTYPNEPLTVSPATQRPLFLTGMPVQLGDDVCPGWILTFGSSRLWARALGPWVKSIQFWLLWFYSDWVSQRGAVHLSPDRHSGDAHGVTFMVCFLIYVYSACPSHDRPAAHTDRCSRCLLLRNEALSQISLWKWRALIPI